MCIRDSNNPVTCSEDTECSTGLVCVTTQPSDCICEHTNICKPVCTAQSCAAGESCRADGHCAPTVCVTGADCVPHFECTPAADNTHECTRKYCEDDTGCPGGACVLGQCFETAGQCQLPVP